jgi:hypothetical protein
MPHLHTPIFPSQWEQTTKMRLPLFQEPRSTF